ncbi:amino acid racemase [Affinibrenneria salicis]|uniref:Amino acid racemase n=1 Tax=Affinibrenneria salicis TaxID=2590031 RepID=A0A5J5G321_9GAMM|nr:amino acid racemase [Affinibrenneria salicis]KAA9000473.1 amino acid racemase [Affinibrenneria salicis]
MNNMIGILGGMGPGATVDAMHKLIRNTPALSDQQHIPVIAVSIPDIPDRTQCILHHGLSPLKKMIQYMRILENAGANCIIIPCNTAHYWFDEIKSRSRVDMISIIDAACAAIHRYRINKVGLLATTATVQARIYQRKLQESGAECLTPRDNQQQQVMAAIYALKGGREEEAQRLLNPIKERMLADGVDKIILGCSEIPLILAADIRTRPENYIDATEELVRQTVNWYFAHQPRESAPAE